MKNLLVKSLFVIFIFGAVYFLFFYDTSVNGVTKKEYKEIQKNYKKLSLKYINYVKEGRKIGYITDEEIEVLRAVYIFLYARKAQEIHKMYGIPASIVMGQAALESDFGTSSICRDKHNHFNIRYAGSRKYRKFKSDEACFDYYVKVLLLDRYDECHKCRTLKCWAREIEEAGFATADNYAEAVLGIIVKYSLDKRLDTTATYTLTPAEIKKIAGESKK